MYEVFNLIFAELEVILTTTLFLVIFCFSNSTMYHKHSKINENKYQLFIWKKIIAQMHLKRSYNYVSIVQFQTL